jgi:hypothetical protein
MEQPNKSEEKAKGLTATDAAKAVKRPVVETVDTGKTDDAGKPITKQVTKRVPVTASEVLDFKDYGSHVVVVTTDGLKLSSAD